MKKVRLPNNFHGQVQTMKVWYGTSMFHGMKSKGEKFYVIFRFKLTGFCNFQAKRGFMVFDLRRYPLSWFEEKMTPFRP